MTKRDKAEAIVTRAQNWHSRWEDKLPRGAAFELRQILLGLPTPPAVPPNPFAKPKKKPWWKR